MVAQTVAVVLKISSGTFETGFLVTLRVLRDGRLLYEEAGDAPIPPAPELPKLYESWLTHYKKLGGRVIKAVSGQITTHSTLEACQSTLIELTRYLKRWFAHSAFHSLRNQILVESGVKVDSSIPIVIEAYSGLDETDRTLLYKIPWALWTDLFDRLPNADAVLGIGKKNTVMVPSRTHTIKILAIFGSCQGLDLDSDRQTLKKQRGVKTTFLEQPQRDQLHEHLTTGSYSLVFFSGHSTSELSKEGDDGGYLQFNDHDRLSLNDLRKDLEQAIANGLQCIVFNSCDELGLASYLADLKVPYVVVMKEPVSDRVAREFLKAFLQEFFRGEIPLHVAVRRARDRLHWLESDRYPCLAASWLPIVVCHPNQDVLMWSKLKPQINLTDISNLHVNVRVLLTKIPLVICILLFGLGVMLLLHCFVTLELQAMRAIAGNYGGIYRSPSILTFRQETVTAIRIWSCSVLLDFNL